MSKRAQCGLLFLKTGTSLDAVKYFISQQSTSGGYSALYCLNTMDLYECESLLDDLNDCISMHRNVQTEFISDGVEHTTISFEYPNIHIGDNDNTLILPMYDMRDLLQEWILFMKN